jgi:hypothetical protein
MRKRKIIRQHDGYDVVITADAEGWTLWWNDSKEIMIGAFNGEDSLGWIRKLPGRSSITKKPKVNGPCPRWVKDEKKKIS